MPNNDIVNSAKYKWVRFICLEYSTPNGFLSEPPVVVKVKMFGREVGIGPTGNCYSLELEEPPINCSKLLVIPREYLSLLGDRIRGYSLIINFAYGAFI